MVGIGVVISSLEILARPEATNDVSWNSWRVLRLRRSWSAAGWTGRAFSLALDHPQYLVVIAVRTVAAAVLALTGPDGALGALLLWVVTLSLALRGLRTPYGGEGSDQVFLLVCGALALAATFGGQRMALWFIAAQVALSYFTSGFAKILHGDWRNGTALLGVMRTRTWGNEGAARWLDSHTTACRWLSRAMISAEAGFPLVLLAPSWMLPVLIGAGLGFHLIIAIVMGLNCFVWAFASTYPAVIYVVLTRP
ncbi:hypothetical protein [Catenulispora subtropica]|uniref:HTTM-like domain-containing protein n=1 Tax=Catenulispora subtropica TaxID=450798 RepID=A0ABN2RRN7_9ACTN